VFVAAHADVIIQDQTTGCSGSPLEMGRNGMRMQVRRNGFVTENAAMAEYRRLCRQRDARVARPRLSDTVQTVCQDWLLAREHEVQPNTLCSYGRMRASRLSARMTERA
jgi:hypothetical protein